MIESTEIAALHSIDTEKVYYVKGERKEDYYDPIALRIRFTENFMEWPTTGGGFGGRAIHWNKDRSPISSIEDTCKIINILEKEDGTTRKFSVRNVDTESLIIFEIMTKKIYDENLFKEDPADTMHIVFENNEAVQKYFRETSFD